MSKSSSASQNAELQRPQSNGLILLDAIKFLSCHLERFLLSWEWEKEKVTEWNTE